MPGYFRLIWLDQFSTRQVSLVQIVSLFQVISVYVKIVFVKSG